MFDLGHQYRGLALSDPYLHFKCVQNCNLLIIQIVATCKGPMTDNKWYWASHHTLSLHHHEGMNPPAYPKLITGKLFMALSICPSFFLNRNLGDSLSQCKETQLTARLPYVDFCCTWKMATSLISRLPEEPYCLILQTEKLFKIEPYCLLY